MEVIGWEDFGFWILDDWDPKDNGSRPEEK